LATEDHLDILNFQQGLATRPVSQTGLSGTADRLGGGKLEACALQQQPARQPCQEGNPAKCKCAPSGQKNEHPDLVNPVLSHLCLKPTHIATTLSTVRTEGKESLARIGFRWYPTLPTRGLSRTSAHRDRQGFGIRLGRSPISMCSPFLSAV
jgi:hypothetical protein